MPGYIERAVTLKIGNIYVTDDKLPNQWDSMPTYWKSEVDKIKASSTQ